MVPAISGFHVMQDPLSDITAVLGYDLHPQLTPSTVLGSLENVGHTCYLNSILFAWSRLVAVREWTQQHASQHSGGHECLLCTLAVDVHAVAHSTRHSLHSPHIAAMRGRWCPEFNDTRQRDAHEFYNKLVNACDKVDVDAFNLLTDGTLTNSATAQTTPLWQLFRLRGYSHVICTECGQSSTAYWIQR